MRKRIFDAYTQAFSADNRFVMPVYETNDTRSSYHLYPLRIKGATETQRDAIISKIFEKQVSVNVHFIPVPMMSFYKKLGYNIANYPNTYAQYSTEISLPVYYDLGPDKVKTVTDAVIASVNEVIG